MISFSNSSIMGKKLITWNEEYSVGYNEIDTQHKKLIDIINVMFSAFSSGKARELVPDVINKLIEYTKYHFETEEKYFYKYQYPKTEEHIEKHKEFIQMIQDFEIKFKTKDKNLHYDILYYLKNWLTDHILGDDKTYANFFTDNKIEKL